MKGGSISCLEEMEQAQEVRGQERVEARVEEKAAKAGEVVLLQDQVGIVSARTAVKKFLMNGGFPASKLSVPNATVP